MGNKARKRDRDHAPGENDTEAPAKRRRQINEEQIKLAKLYEDLAAESDDVRFAAAKQLIVKFSSESAPLATEVETALSRLVKGLCSQRKAARVGFSLTLTELLRQNFGANSSPIQGLKYDVASLIKLVEDKTKVEGNVPGRARRDHLIGKLFGYKAVLQSSIILEPKLSMECWNKLLDHVYGMARDVPWLREECGMIIVDAVRSLRGQTQYRECADQVIRRLNAFKLISTPEGVAIWLTVRESFKDALPEGIWHSKDPLARKERTRLAKILREGYQSTTDDGDAAAVKSGTTSPNPSFVWDMVLSETLRRDEQYQNDAASQKAEFPQLWIDIVDNNLFASTSSLERKAWGFKLLGSMIVSVPEASISALLSPNLMRTLINQSKKEDRFLHSAALAALKSVHARVQQEPASAVPIFVSLTSKFGSIEFDKMTKTKTLEQLMLSADDGSLKKIARHLNSIVLRPESEDQPVVDARRQIVADLLLNAVKHYKHYEKVAGDAAEQDGWLRNVLEIFVKYAFFEPSQGAKTSKVPLPPLSNRSRQIFQERLSSCLARLLEVDVDSRSTFPIMVVGMIRSKSASSNSLDLKFKADKTVKKDLEKAFQTLDAISAKGSIAGNKLAAKGFILLYSFTLLQVYNGEGDAVMMLDDLDAAHKTMLQNGKNKVSEGADVFVEIILSFLGNQRTVFRRIGEQVLSIFSSEIGSEGLRSLTDVLDTDENLEGQEELFNQEEDGVSSSSEDSGIDSDVEMVDGEGAPGSSDDTSSSDSSDNDEDDEGSKDDAELTQFNNMLALTLQTSKLNANGEDPEGTSDESDMDDEQMMALDPQLSKIFQQRSQTTSKKDREDAKQNVVQFKGRVLDALAIYLEKQYSNPLTLEVLLPVLRRTRANANKQLAVKASKLLKTFLDSRNKHKAPLPKPEDAQPVLETLKAIHEEAAMGGGSNMHADVCSSASLHVVKILVGVDRKNYADVVDVYAGTQKKWFADKKLTLQPALFTRFQNWSQCARQQGK